MFQFAFIVVHLLLSVSAQTWCGKHYKKNSPIVTPGGNFPTPAISAVSLLAFRCAPAVKPYLDGDSANIVIDAPLTFSKIDGAEPISLSSNIYENLEVTISIDGADLAQGTTIPNITNFEVPFSLSSLTPRMEPYTIMCTAKYSDQIFQTTAALSFLPSPKSGSVTKMDLRTGALLAKPANGKGGSYEPVFPIGFYTNIDPYITSDLSVLDELKAQGFTVVHPIPPFNDQTALNKVLDRMEELGLYLIYDMRLTYMDLASVTAQVNQIKSRPNLLLWYTADEPDGTSDPLNATSIARDLIIGLDGGGYHPVSLVLNCFDYEFTPYAAGADIVLQDTYMIGNDVKFSSVWGTPCTTDYGDCGCDDCKGRFEDISDRMDVFAQRFFDNGWERSKAVWTVAQAFGNSTYWPRVPTGKEFVVQTALGINHGALGSVSWSDPTTSDIKASASLLAKSLPSFVPFLMDPTVRFQHFTVKRVDVGIWVSGQETLMLATNMNYKEAKVSLGDVGFLNGGLLKQVFDGGAKLDGQEVVLEAVGTGAFVFAWD